MGLKTVWGRKNQRYKLRRNITDTFVFSNFFRLQKIKKAEIFFAGRIFLLRICSQNKESAARILLLSRKKDPVFPKKKPCKLTFRPS